MLRSGWWWRLLSNMNILTATEVWSRAAERIPCWSSGSDSVLPGSRAQSLVRKLDATCRDEEPAQPNK